MISTSPEFENEPKTRLALLGTLGHLHTEPLRYDLACLRSLVEALEPDLLGVEVEPEAWERGDLRGAPVEVRDGLVPAARRTDTVIVPLGGPSPVELAPPERGELARLRANLMQGADRLLTELQRVSDGPEGVNSALFGHVCGLICTVEAAVAGDAGRRAWQTTNERILERLLWAMRRDPGRRVLVAMQCQRVHWLELRLKRVPNIELVDYRDL
ncbi:MAG: hypothetical protein ACETWR_08310 [Anaerolineae bacterium]